MQLGHRSSIIGQTLIPIFIVTATILAGWVWINAASGFLASTDPTQIEGDCISEFRNGYDACGSGPS
jgi:hypothetical protein